MFHDVVLGAVEALRPDHVKNLTLVRLFPCLRVADNVAPCCPTDPLTETKDGVDVSLKSRRRFQRKQTSVIAGTIMNQTHLPLRQWFLAAHLVTTHSNGISPLQLQARLGIGSYKSVCMLLHKLRRAMVNPDREKLGGYDEVVEIDETSIPFRTEDEPAGGGSIGAKRRNALCLPDHGRRSCSLRIDQSG